ncbi:aminoacyl-tRNA hydrolase [Candidatus Neomarinimicrobiota bacterium]
MGLGNPGRRFARTRHNFGYRVADRFAESRQAAFVPGKGDYVFAVPQTDDLAVIKPTSFMNVCGIPVQDAMAFFKATPEDTLVVFDDIDLPLGTMRFRVKGGAGGHRGVESIIYQLGSEDFPRLRLGIASDVPMRPSEKYVLESFLAGDKPVVEEVTQRSVDGINDFLTYGVDSAMTRFNAPVMDISIEGKGNPF